MYLKFYKEENKHTCIQFPFFFYFFFFLQEWFEGLRKLTPNTKANNICPMTSLKKQ